MSEIKLSYQRLHWRLTTVFSVCFLVIILIYMGMITLSQSIAKFGFEQEINERLEGMTVEGSKKISNFFYWSQPGRQCEPGDQAAAPSVVLKMRGDNVPHRLPAPMIVQTSFAQYAKHTWIHLWIFSFFVWLFGSLVGYFLTGWLIRPARQAAQDQEIFLANASHELKTPITTIKTELALLGTQKLETRVKDSWRVVGLENQTLQNLVDKLLLATTKQQTIKEPTDVNNLIQERLQVHQKNYLKQHLTFQLSGKAVTLTTDPYKLAQILDLLLDNAGKYSSPRTTVKVKVALEGKQALIKIINQGLGIVAEDQEKIFRRFYRVTSKEVQLQPGSGLGLAIAREQTGELGGSLTLVTGKATATCFQISLPLK
jgi:signal transduction histidine kinase